MKDLRVPDPHAVEWVVTDKQSGAFITIKARLWCEARDEGSRALGVDRYAVTCTRAEEE